MTLEEQLEQTQALADQVASTRLTLAKEHLYDEHWRVYGDVGIWHRKIETNFWWRYNVTLDVLYLGVGKSYIRNAFRYLYKLKQESGLPTSDTRDLKPVGKLRKLGPDYDVASLSTILKKAHSRIPPSQEWLALRYGWDEDLKAFFHVVNDRLEYQMPGAFVTLEDGALYATWRVKSMLIFGNPDGLVGETASAERNRALLNTAPDVVTGIAADLADAFPDYSKSTIKYRKVVDRAKELEEAAAKKERAASEKARTRAREKEKIASELNAKRVQDIREARARADELLAEFEKETSRLRRRLLKREWNAELSKIRSSTG